MGSLLKMINSSFGIVSHIQGVRMTMLQTSSDGRVGQMNKCSPVSGKVSFTRYKPLKRPINVSVLSCTNANFGESIDWVAYRLGASD